MRRAPDQFQDFTAFSECSDTFQEANVSSSNGRLLRNVTIIKAGLGNKRDKHLYTKGALKEAVDKGMFTDLRAFLDHPTKIDEQVQPERTVRDFVGVYRNPRFVESGNSARVVADLHILEPYDWLAKGIHELASLGMGDKIGISILGAGKTSAAKYQEAGSEPIMVQRVDQFTGVKSADIVTQAGAGGGFSNLLESARDAVSKEQHMDPKAILAQIVEAAAAGDIAKVTDLTAKLTEATAEKVDADKVDADEKAEESYGDDMDKVEEKKAPAKKSDKTDPEDDADGGADEADEKPAKEAAVATKKVGKKMPTGKKFGECANCDGSCSAMKEADALRAEVATLQGKIAAADMHAYVAKRVREAKLPEKSRGKLAMKLQEADNRADVDREVQFAEAFFADVKEAALSEFDEVEGVGGSQNTGTQTVQRLTEAITGTGLKMKKAK